MDDETLLVGSENGSEISEQLLAEVPEGVLDRLYLVAPAFKDSLDAVLDGLERLRPSRVYRGVEVATKGFSRLFPEVWVVLCSVREDSNNIVKFQVLFRPLDERDVHPTIVRVAGSDTNSYR